MEYPTIAWHDRDSADKVLDLAQRNEGVWVQLSRNRWTTRRLLVKAARQRGLLPIFIAHSADGLLVAVRRQAAS